MGEFSHILQYKPLILIFHWKCIINFQHCTSQSPNTLPPHRHLERMPVILSEAKDLGIRRARSFASLRMTGRTSLKSAHGKSSLQMSITSVELLTIDKYVALLPLKV